MGYDIFLAHAPADKIITEKLYDALVARGVRVFFDARCIPLGARRDLEIPRAQRDARITAVLVSRNFDQDWYLGDEISNAIAALRDTRRAHTVIPVFLDGVPVDAFAFPRGLREVHGIDFPKEGGLDTVADRLRDAVAHAHGSPLPVVSPPAPRPARCQRGALHERLCRLLDVQFEAMILHAQLDRSVIAGPTAPLARRAIDVTDLVTQGGEPVCARVCAAIEKVAPELR
jgi:hypothetical protein